MTLKMYETSIDKLSTLAVIIAFRVFILDRGGDTDVRSVINVTPTNQLRVAKRNWYTVVPISCTVVR